MVALLTLFVVLVIALIVNRIATAILTLTGLSREVARFQSRSALTGVGFTTSEAESVVNHPVRRRVVMTLMLVGSAGIITVVASLMLSFVNAGTQQTATRILLLMGGLVAILMVARSSVVDRALSRAIRRALGRWTDLDVRDYAALLHVSGAWGVMELYVDPDDWVAERTLGELGLNDEGLRVLGIVRPDGGYRGAPVRATRVRPGDTLLLYGRDEALAELDRRRAGPEGDRAHEAAVAEQARIVAEEEATDEAPRAEAPR